VDLQAIADKLEIHEQLARYARGVDTRDWELWKSVFTADAVVDYSQSGFACGPRDEVAAALGQAFAAIPWATHHVTNVEIDLDGDRARVRAMFFNPMQLPGVEGSSSTGGYYHHEFVRTTEGWKSEHLVEEPVWFLNGPGG
jgi:hypothetical protein